MSQTQYLKMLEKEIQKINKKIYFLEQIFLEAIVMRNLYQTKLQSFYSQNKRMPTYSEMLKLFGFKSKNAVFKVVEKLKEAGMVAKDHLGRLVPSKIFQEVPMLGL